MAEPRSRLLALGKPTGTVLVGRSIVAQYAVGAEFLLFVTPDTWDDETLEIGLLTSDGTVLDLATLIKWPLAAAGEFRNVEVHSEEEISFLFFMTDLKPWSVRVLCKTRWRLPFLAGPFGVSRPFGLKTRLLIWRS